MSPQDFHRVNVTTRTGTLTDTDLKLIVSCIYLLA